MSRFPRMKCAPALAVFSLAAGMFGCGQPVREDRTITWSKGGNAVGFQHGAEGVFVANKDGNKLHKVFQPGPEVLATSTPLWHPARRQFVFTTARSAQHEIRAAPRIQLGQDDPDGAIFFQHAVVYTCWLGFEAAADEQPAPVRLFEAECDHVGYVAANLAVRWHPEQDRILYVKQVGKNQHGLFEFDLATKRSRQIVPHTGEALIFDWLPNGSHLVLLLGSKSGVGAKDGIWIGRPGEEDWWQAPHSGTMPLASCALLEQLRLTRPAWSGDGSRFAFVTFSAARTAHDPRQCRLWLGWWPGRRVERLLEGTELVREVHWSPDGDRLGFVRGEAGNLYLLRPGDQMSGPINRKPVRRFAGWSASGEHLGYVVADPPPLGDADGWALLLLPSRNARDAVYIGPGGGGDPGREVFAGLRVTFPHWSPTESKLTLWLTFSPAYRSWLSMLLGTGLRRGDPAAILDARTGALGWMAVNAVEKVQVGHYHLMKRDYPEAWRWYQEAERDLPPGGPLSLQQFSHDLRNLIARRGFAFFQYHCLWKLNRHEEAQGKLRQFNDAFLPTPDDLLGPRILQAVNGLEGRLREALQPGSVLGLLLKDLYAAEAFLSLDAVEDGEAYFRQAVADSSTDAARLSSSLVLGQMLLLQKKHRDFADLATEVIFPLRFKLWKPENPNPGQARDLFDLQPIFDLVCTAGLLPVYSPEFLALLSEEHVRSLTPQWEKWRAALAHEQARLEAELFLYAACGRLGRMQEQAEAERRLRDHPAGQRLHDGDVAGWSRRFRTTTRALADQLDEAGLLGALFGRP